MDKELYIPWLGMSDSHPASIRLPKHALKRAAEQRGAPAPESAWMNVRSVTCLTRLDATLDARFQPEGSCRGIDVLEVKWSDTLRDEKALSAIALALDAAIPLDRTFVCFIHVTRDTVDTRLVVCREGKVAFDKIWSHAGIMSYLPVFGDDALQKATSISSWHNALFSLLHTANERDRLQQQLNTLRGAMTREKDFGKKTELRAQLLATQQHLKELSHE